MTDGDKIAAAILACEASRQKVIQTGSEKKARDIAAELLNLYAFYLSARVKDDSAK